MNKFDALCLCKHAYREHRRIEGKNWNDCWARDDCGALLGKSGNYVATYCTCMRFKLDNLKYLEGIYDRTQNLA